MKNSNRPSPVDKDTLRIHALVGARIPNAWHTNAINNEQLNNKIDETETMQSTIEFLQ